MKIVIALGGNALLRRSDPMTTEIQRRNIKIAAQAIAPLAAVHSIVVVHGNGPQWACCPCRPSPTGDLSRTRWTCWTPAPRA
jgi:carbamate kinase